MRSITRVVHCSINTVTKLLTTVGAKCDYLQYQMLRNLPCKNVQVDEIWSFCYGRNKNLPADKLGRKGYGDIWTWTAVCPDSKLVICWKVGSRDLDSARGFLCDLSTRLASRVQITSDGHHSYLQAVEAAFGGNVNYGMLIKNYENDALSLEKQTIIGNPDTTKISTSAVERQNLSIRMGVRRFTRKTNAHSKKIVNHCHALSLYFFYHNFIRINIGLRVAPAMELGIVNRLWSWEELL